MFSSLKNMMGGDRSSQSGPSSNPAKIKADQPVGLQALLGDDPPRLDGSDRFFGMENVVGLRPDQPNGNTCYANSILQCLYYSKPFRESVVNFPFRAQPPYQPKESNANGSQTSPVPDRGQLVRVNTELLPTMSAAAYAAMRQRSAVSPGGAVDSKKKPLPGAGSVASPTNNAMENKDSPEYKKKKALENGPILEIDQLNNSAYGMSENLFSALKDIFESIMATGSRTGIIKPNKFLEILRRENEMFSGQTHQDAHEFLNYVLNEVIENVDSFQKRMKNENINITLPIKAATAESLTPINASSTASTSSLSTSTAVTGWIHDLFEGLLTSETKCLTCENVSRRDEQFLDLSIDLEKNSSVTSCLRNFSASEMLCERNKFHCDTCGGLQEAEKRMKVKKLPKVLALHLKRFKYMEQTSKFEKLHHRVLYPYHLRLFNTTDDADDPDRLYELYAVVVHIGGGPFHGHYVAIIKTEDKGWLLFDDEILFYQETTLEAVQSEQWSDFLPTSGATHDVSKSEQIKTRAPVNGATNGINGHVSPPALNPDSVDLAPRPLTSPEAVRVTPPVPVAAENPMPMVKSKKEREREKKEEKEREKAQRKAEKEKREAKEKENGVSVSNGGEGSGMSRFRTTSKSMRKKPQWFGSKEKDKAADVENEDDLHPLPPTPGFGPLDGGKPANKKSLNLERKPAPVSENGKENGKETPKDTEESEKDLEKDQERASDTDSGKEHGKEHGIGSRFRRKHKDGKKEQKEHKKDKSDDIVPKKHHSHRPSLLNLNGLRKKSAAIGARD